MLCMHAVPGGPDPTLELTCSSIKCTEQQILHNDCFDKLEKLLIQAAAGNARCRSWSENQVSHNKWPVYAYFHFQIRMNLWLSLIHI